MSAAPPIAAVLSMDGCWSVSAKSDMAPLPVDHLVGRPADRHRHFKIQIKSIDPCLQLTAALAGFKTKNSIRAFALRVIA
jgi:hypothetical protein